MKISSVAAAVLLGGLCAVPAFAHGGQYRGPGGTVPPGGGGAGGVAGPATPGTPGGASGDQTAWTVWWDFNKEPFLDLRARVRSGAALTGSEGWYLGRGQRRQDTGDLGPSEEQIRQVVVPALLRALETETNNDIVTGSLIALAKIGDPAEGDSFAPTIARFLSNPVQEIRETAAVSLGILAEESSLPTLAALLADDERGRALAGGGEVDYRTRSFAAYGLALIGARTADESVRREAVRRLRTALDTDDTRSRDLGVACVIALGLVPLQTMQPEEVAGDAAPAPETSRMAQIDYLLRYLDDGRHPYLVRAHAPTALARLSTGLPQEIRAAVVGRVARSLMKRCGGFTGEPKEVVQSCVLALGAIGDLDDDPLDVEIRQSLIDVPKRVRDQLARNFSLIALGQLAGDLGSGSGIEKGLQQTEKHLLRQLSEGRETMKPWAALAIGVMGRSLEGVEPAAEVLGTLRQAVHGALAAEKAQGLDVGAYAIAAGLLRSSASADELLKKLAGMQDDQARGYVAVALGLIGARQALEPLREAVRGAEYRPALLTGAAIGLALLGDKEVVLELIRMLGEARGLAAAASISSALGFIGDRRSIDPLVVMLRNQDLTATARGFAAVALGIVADKERLPWNAKIAVGLNYDAATQTLNDASGKGILNIL